VSSIHTGPQHLADTGPELFIDAGPEPLADAGPELITDPEPTTDAGAGSVAHVRSLLVATGLATPASVRFADPIPRSVAQPGREPHADLRGRRCRRSVRRNVLDREARRGR
jgi:hypothetical protein